MIWGLAPKCWVRVLLPEKTCFERQKHVFTFKKGMKTANL